MRPIRKILPSICASLLYAGVLHAAGSSVANTKVHLGSYGLYSPVVREGRLFIGGWASAADPETYMKLMADGQDPEQHFGPDKIYTGRIKDTPEQTAASLKLAFVHKGYHVNDPTVVAPPSETGVDRSDWLYMYFTMLDNRIAERCRKEDKNLLECPYVFEGHDIGFASSVDGGDSWTFRGIVISAAQSGDGAGAWMPSVIVEDEQLWLYYSSGRQNFNQENIFRQKLKPNGHEKIGAAEPVRLSGFAAGDLVANIEVVKINGNAGYMLTGNDGPQKSLPVYSSLDGLSFKLLEKSMLGSQPDNVLTPFVESASFDGAGALRFKLFWAVARGHWELKSADVKVSVGSTPTATATATATLTGTSTSTATATNSRSIETDRYEAGKAFVDAFASLLTAKQNGATGEGLRPFIEVCVAAQNNARNWGVPNVDAYTCE